MLELRVMQGTRVIIPAAGITSKARQTSR